MAERVVVVGGGPAGLAAAIAAAQQGAQVTIIERDRDLGRRILATGNGRCNFTHKDITPDAYNHSDFMAPLLAKYPSERIVEFFEALGLDAVCDDEGRVYPATNMAASVVEVLKHECERFGIKQQCDSRVRDVSQNTPSGLMVETHDGMLYTCEAVVVATGGDTPLLRHIGHKAEKCLPVLCPLKTKTAKIAGFDGIRVRCAATLLESSTPVRTERGELLFRDYGVSGILIFDLSRYIHKGQEVSIDFFPDFSVDALVDKLAQRCDAFAWRSDATFFDGLLPSVIGRRIIELASRQPASMATLLKDFRLEVTGLGDSKRAQVMRGGAKLDEFNPATLESMLMPGLYAAGEVLDIDGRCGGYNLHWAWMSGLIAGAEAARPKLP